MFQTLCTSAPMVSEKAVQTHLVTCCVLSNEYFTLSTLSEKFYVIYDLIVKK